MRQIQKLIVQKTTYITKCSSPPVTLKSGLMTTWSTAIPQPMMKNENKAVR